MTVPLEGQLFLILAVTGSLVCLTDFNQNRLQRETLFWSAAVAIICLPTLMALTIWPKGGIVPLVWSVVTIVAALRVWDDLRLSDRAEVLWKKGR